MTEKGLRLPAYGCVFKSRAELTWARILTYLRAKWAYEPEKLSTLVNGRKLTYTPDFRVQLWDDGFLDGAPFWVEVKGSYSSLRRKDCWTCARGGPYYCCLEGYMASEQWLRRVAVLSRSSIPIVFLTGYTAEGIFIDTATGRPVDDPVYDIFLEQVLHVYKEFEVNYPYGAITAAGRRYAAELGLEDVDS